MMIQRASQKLLRCNLLTSNNNNKKFLKTSSSIASLLSQQQPQPQSLLFSTRVTSMLPNSRTLNSRSPLLPNHHHHHDTAEVVSPSSPSPLPLEFNNHTNKHTWHFVAYNISRSINLDTSTNEALNDLCKEFGCWKMEDGKVSLILQLNNNLSSTSSSSTTTTGSASSSSTSSSSEIGKSSKDDGAATASASAGESESAQPTMGMMDVGTENNRYSYIILYHFGSVCFMNCSDQLQQRWISRLCRHQGSTTTTTTNGSSGPATASSDSVITKDYLRVVIDQQSPDWCKMGKDHMIVQKLDFNNLNIISGVLSRSIALKSYEISAQNTLENFRSLNTHIEKTGKISRQDEKRLVPVFANANGLKCDLLLSVRLLERPDVTWAFQHYDQIYEVLQAEFEIQNRFEHLDKKLDFIQQNNMFYMELQHSRKSETSEWLIIVLIATEICIALIHHYRESSEKKQLNAKTEQQDQ